LARPIQKRYELVRELKLSSKKREDICKKYGYTRKMGNEYINAWDEKRWEGIKDEARGPKSKSKCTEKLKTES